MCDVLLSKNANLKHKTLKTLFLVYPYLAPMAFVLVHVHGVTGLNQTRA